MANKEDFFRDKEDMGWMIIAEKSMSKIWDNEVDEIWNEL